MEPNAHYRKRQPGSHAKRLRTADWKRLPAEDGPESGILGYTILELNDPVSLIEEKAPMRGLCVLAVWIQGRGRE